MGVQVQLLLTACCFVFFGLTSVRPHNQTADQALNSAANDETEVRENFQNLFDSIAKNHERKSEIYHEILKQEATREQQAFDTIRKELQIAQNRNAYKKQNFYQKKIVSENVEENESGVNENDRHIGGSWRSARSLTVWKDILDAAANGDLEAVKHFLERDKKAAITKNEAEETAAHIAAKNGNLELLKHLLTANSSLAGAKDVNGNTVLDVAAEVGALPLVKYLIDDVQVDLHRTNCLRIGNNVLHIAAEAGQLPVLKYLIEEKKLDPNARNDLKQTAAFLAAGNKHLEVLRYLVEDRKVDVTVTDFNDNNILYMSAPIGDLSVPRYLLDERKIDLDINWRDSRGETLLQRAARFNQLAFVKYLLGEKHANPDQRDLHGRSALHEAATKANMEVLRYMVEQGANTEIKDLYNQTPLRVASDEDVIEYLSKQTTQKAP